MIPVPWWDGDARERDPFPRKGDRPVVNPDLHKGVTQLVGSVFDRRWSRFLGPTSVSQCHDVHVVTPSCVFKGPPIPSVVIRGVVVRRPAGDGAKAAGAAPTVPQTAMPGPPAGRAHQRSSVTGLPSAPTGIASNGTAPRDVHSIITTCTISRGGGGVAAHNPVHPRGDPIRPSSRRSTSLLYPRFSGIGPPPAVPASPATLGGERVTAGCRRYGAVGARPVPPRAQEGGDGRTTDPEVGRVRGVLTQGSPSSANDANVRSSIRRWGSGSNRLPDPDPSQGGWDGGGVRGRGAWAGHAPCAPWRGAPPWSIPARGAPGKDLYSRVCVTTGGCCVMELGSQKMWN